MSQFPSAIDTDVDLPRVDDNLTEIGGIAINSIRSAVFAVEREMGIGGSGSSGSIADRINVSLNANGTLKSAAIFAAGALTGPISNTDVASNAGIAESKLGLTYSTQNLFNLIGTLSSKLDNIIDLFTFLNSDFNKHITGQSPLHNSASGRHDITHIDSTSALHDATGAARPLRLDGILSSLNTDLVNHENAGKVSGDPVSIAHVAAGISVATSGFTTIPTATDTVQKVVDYIDQTSFAGLKKHEQNNHSNGIPRTFRSSLISTTDGSNQGQNVVSSTRVYTYLGASGAGVVDSINNGDDIIEFDPVSNVDNVFDASFAGVKAGDIITVDYGTSISSFVISEVLSSSDSSVPPNKTFLVRINGRNVDNIIRPSSAAHARIDRVSFNETTDNILAVAASNNDFGVNGSLIVGNPRGAMAMGLGFAPERFDSTHFKLYLQLYPNGTSAKVINLPAVDVTGNAGATPGAYTLDSIVSATNEAFRAKGFNYRFIAFSHRGEFGIALADSINNVSFSIISGTIDGTGALVQSGFPNNVVGLGLADPLGFGVSKANVASPPFTTSYPNVIQSKFPTILFTPLKNKTAYINGNGIDTLASVSDGTADSAGIHFWPATITDSHVIANSTVQVTYTVPLDLSAYDLRPGKTIICQPSDPSTLNTASVVDYGRFTIQSVSFIDCPGQSGSTTITVRNAVHGVGIPVYPTSAINSAVRLYFSSDSVGFEGQNLLTSVPSAVYKRYFEVLVDQIGATVSHERARLRTDNISATPASFNFISVSPKLRGYSGSGNKQITLRISSFDVSTGIITGFLCNSPTTNLGPVAVGKQGERIRFFDESNVDYVDVVMNFGASVNSITNSNITIELFQTLSLDSEFMLLATCQLNDANGIVTNVFDRRSFGTLSERDFSDSASNFITTGDRIALQNGVARGFDSNGIVGNVFSLTGGTALVNGKFVELNEYSITIPRLSQYTDSVTINSKIFWALCANDTGHYTLLPLRDSVSFVGTVDPNRIFTFSDPTTTFAYSVESSTFPELIDRKKNLTILYTVFSDNSNGTISVEDARRFVNDTNASMPIVIAQGTNQGNFKTTSAALTWLNHDSSNHGIVVLRGSTPVSSALTLSSPSQVEFIADGASFNVTSTLTVGPNAVIRNATFNLSGSGTIVALANTTFVNCTFIGTSSGTMLSVGASSGVSVNDCTFEGTCVIGLSMTSSTNAHINALKTSGLTASSEVLNLSLCTSVSVNDSIFSSSSATLLVSDSSNIFFKNCSAITSSSTALCLFIATSNNVVLSNSTLTGVIAVNGSSFVSFDKCSITGTSTVQSSTNVSFEKCSVANASTTIPNFYLVNSSKINFNNNSFTSAGPVIVKLNSSNYSSFKNTEFTSTYDCTSDSAYVSSNLVNSISGMFFSDTSHVGTKFEGCTFNIQTPSTNYYPAICSIFNISTIIVRSMVVKGCKFITNITNDKRAIIAIVSKVTPLTFGTTLNVDQPTFADSEISNNSFDSNQSIIISSNTNSFLQLAHPGLVASNVVVEKNACGAIGYLISSPTKLGTTGNNPLIDRRSGLVIQNNNCHYIGSLDANAIYRSAADTPGTSNNIDYPSGFVKIIGNNCCWIHTLVSSSSDSDLKISKNNLYAFDSTFTSSYVDSNNTAIFVTAPPQSLNVDGIGNNSNLQIEGNTVDVGGAFEKTGYSSPLTYAGVITTYASANITDNTLHGCNTTSSIVSLFGPNTVMTGNRLFRDNSPIVHYIVAATGTTGTIVGNFFDSYEISTGSNNEAILSLPAKWTCNSNKNQTEYVSVSWTESKIATVTGGFSNLIADSGFQVFIPPTVGGYGGYVSDILYLVEKTASSGGIARGLGFTQNLNKYVPFGTTILYVQMDAATTSQVASDMVHTGTNTIFINLASRSTFQASSLDPTTSASIQLSNIDNSYHDDGVTKLFAGKNINDTDFPDPTLSQDGTIPQTTLAIDVKNWPGGSPTDHTGDFIVDSNHSVMATLDVFYLPVQNADLWLSPLLVKFRW